MTICYAGEEATHLSTSNSSFHILLCPPGTGTLQIPFLPESWVCQFSLRAGSANWEQWRKTAKNGKEKTSSLFFWGACQQHCSSTSLLWGAGGMATGSNLHISHSLNQPQHPLSETLILSCSSLLKRLSPASWGPSRPVSQHHPIERKCKSHIKF